MYPITSAGSTGSITGMSVGAGVVAQGALSVRDNKCGHPELDDGLRRSQRSRQSLVRVPRAEFRMNGFCDFNHHVASSCPKLSQAYQNRFRKFLL